MKRKILWLIFGLFCCLQMQRASAQSISNEGLEFWAVFPSHDHNNSGVATVDINVTSKSNSEVIVSCGTWSSPITAIPANRVVTFVIPREVSYISSNESNRSITNRAIHIKVSPGKPKVVAYSHVHAGNRSGATLILPVEALGQKYFSMNYTQDDDGNTTNRNFLVLVASEDDTDLLIHTYMRGTVSVNLKKKGDVYQYMPEEAEDITGVSVEVDPLTSECKSFAAFSGSTSVSIGCRDGRDPLIQQLYAVNNWGRVYGVVPFVEQRYIIRVLAQEDNTSVEVNGVQVAILVKGQYFERTYTEPLIIKSNNLISVAQYAYSQNCAGIRGERTANGDPEMVLLNPVEFNIKQITLFSSPKRLIRERYINVFMKYDKTATFTMNGAPQYNWKRMPSDADYAYIQIPVYDESLTLSASEGFNAIAYGMGEFESYAYSAGTSLASTQTLEFINNKYKTVNASACVGEENDLKLTLPYLVDRITWVFSDGTPNFVDNKPSYTIGEVTGQRVYHYVTPAKKRFNQLGTTVVTALINLNATSVPKCLTSSSVEIAFTSDITAVPSADFEVPSDICAGAEVQLFDRSQLSDGLVSDWKWEIDGETYTDKNPVVIFKEAKTYQVKLAVASPSGCWSEVTKSVSIRKYLPVIRFSALDPVCVNGEKVQFTAAETLGLSATSKEFSGKGVSVDGLFDPKAAGVGVHTITYTFTSSDGCINSVAQDIEVFALPEVESKDKIYLLAGGRMPIGVKIKNEGENFTYQWSPSLGLSQDDIINPEVFIGEDTHYTLTIKVKNACDITVSVDVVVLKDLEPSNIFSPNGDGINDVWNIDAIGSYPDVLVEVFNRNGQRVFESKGYKTPFDGTYKNQPLPVGVYYYMIDPKNGKKKISGALTIIR